MTRTFLFTSIVPPHGLKGRMEIARTTWQELQSVVRIADNYIGHEETAQMFGLHAHRGEARPQAGDRAYVIRFKARMLRPRAHLGVVNPQDFEVLRIDYR